MPPPAERACGTGELSCAHPLRQPAPCGTPPPGEYRQWPPASRRSSPCRRGMPCRSGPSDPAACAWRPACPAGKAATPPAL
ncbi:hypothetical protein AI28_01050 [bacteria symbiont BFo1 of Frankliniella occidentalis]|nr:hypothetical protein AI28_01050 [bacteria symbiont BFo1 of Frankliniella occidentalis]